MNPMLSAHNATCSRVIGGQPTEVHDLTVELAPGSLNIVFGPAGSGKNLMLRLLALMERTDRGEISVQEESTGDWPDAKRTDFRARQFGFVFEAPFLLPSFTVLENIAMPFFKLTAAPPEEAREQMKRVLNFVGIPDYSDSSTVGLPPWVQLRVALGRALVNNPIALFVENLDTMLRDDELIAYLELLAGTRKAFGCTVLVTALSRDLAAFGDRAIEMAGGRIVRDWKPQGLLS